MQKTPLFNGLLYRVFDPTEGAWLFISNTKDYEFRIKYLFGPNSLVNPLDDTTIETMDDGFQCELYLYPFEAKLFVQGVIDGFESKLEALPLSEEYFAMHPEIDEVKYNSRLDPQNSKYF
ncbi:unnamed protein product [Phytomonas sp. Hart1]|nr:unnamed protein product [Phytomonas sp. Hart1]|eukprot:CCW66393.1 unnamed protein product [Phytomonas sp. isolate Hart1]